MQECVESMTSRGRGRGDSSYRGRGGRGTKPFSIQYGNNRLINKDISGMSLLRELENNPDSLKKVQEILKNKSKDESSSSYANILTESEDDNIYERKYSCQDIIFILEKKDLQWKDEPWHILQRYLGMASYTAGSYKQRQVFESMLKATNSIDLRHFLPDTYAKTYNFSKFIIKQIISVEEWGINPLSEKEFYLPEQKISVKYNFWDYKESFYKTLLYQNPNRKHTWFIKICPLVYKRHIPNWFIDWWLIYGADEKILPAPFLELFYKWKKVSPVIIEAEYDKTYSPNMATMHFFCEFGIPWIWRWEPEVSHTQDNTPCLKRIAFIKFWKKMIRNDSQGILEGQVTITQIENSIKNYEERIRLRQQREAFNPFTLIQDRISTPQMSNQEKFDKFMQEAKQAFLQKLGTDNEAELSGSKIDMFQDSQDPLDVNDKEMADFYASLHSNKSEDTLIEDSESNEISEADTSETKSRKKKGKNKRR